MDDPLLFNIFIDNVVLWIHYTLLGNYPDENNVSITGNNKENLTKLLLLNFKILAL